MSLQGTANTVLVSLLDILVLDDILVSADKYIGFTNKENVLSFLVSVLAGTDYFIAFSPIRQISFKYR